jgi:14-3-3 protein epsilon
MKGDYNRYLSEFLLDHEYHDAVEKALTAYKEADALARANLSPTSPIRLGLHLNLSVFFYEIMQKQDDAIKIANDVSFHLNSRRLLNKQLLR